jgi:hypothetical protein
MTAGRQKNKGNRSLLRHWGILTILIGVLGTIVGSYFGSQENVSKRVGLRVATPILSTYNVGSGDMFAMTSFVSEGNPPYKYEISFQDNLIERAVGHADDTGWITKTSTAPETDVSVNLEHTLKVTDEDKETDSYVSSEDKHIKVNPK